MLYHGDCLDILPTLDAESADTVITDPPYGLGFMGKEWDHGVPGERFWVEILRVAKPGAMLLAFGGTRTFHRPACAIEDAGWEMRDCLMWLYGSGFPKSHDISKAIDRAAGAEREVIEVRAGPVPGNHNGGGEYGHGRDRSITAPATPLAEQWSGWGTALKPAWEPILLAMKPCDGTFAQNAERHGVAGLHIDGGRIPTNERAGSRKQDTVRVAMRGRQSFRGKGGGAGSGATSPLGRWPANVLLDDEAGAMLDEQAPSTGATGVVKGTEKSNTGVNCYGAYGRIMSDFQMDGLHGASRFFYCAKASRRERNAGLVGGGAPGDVKNTPNSTPGGTISLETDNLGVTSQPDGGGAPCVRHESKPSDWTAADWKARNANHHPTVKPLALMEYLCELTRTPTGGVVLDPFMGSGSTGAACAKTGREFVGIEREAEYIEIARGRIAAAEAEVGEGVQGELAV